MTVVTTRPDATIANGGSTISGGAATRHAALNDDNDATYVTLGSTYMNIGFAEPTIPGGAILRQVSLKLRGRKTNTGNAQLASFLSLDGGTNWHGIIGSGITWTTITTWVAYTNVDPDAITALQMELTKYAGAADIRIFEAYIDTTYVAKPVTDVTSPSGTLSTTNQPTVVWSNTLDSDGGAQTKYQVKIFSAAQYGAGGFNPETSAPTYDSGELSGNDTSHHVADTLPDATYRAYVKVAQSVDGTDHWSDWDFLGFTVSLNKPAVPNFTLTAQSTFGRIRIVATKQSGSATTTYYQVQRIQPDGTWVDVHTLRGDGLVDASATSATLYDYEARNGVSETYRVRAIHDYGSGAYAYSDWHATASATWTDADQWWLKNPSRPDLNLALTLRSQPGRNRPARRGVFTPIGAKYPVVVTDKRAADEGDVSFRLSSEAERLALDDLLDAISGPMLLQGPSNVMWRDRWIVLGDLAEERALDAAWFTHTFDSFSWNEVARPTGAVVEAWIDPNAAP